MAITKTQGYKASDGVVYATVEEAQASEMLALLNTIDGTGLLAADDADKMLTMMATDLVKHAPELIAILTTGPRSRPKARKAAGTTNPKRAVKRATPEQAAAGFAGMRRAAAAPATEAPEQEPCDTAAYVTNGSD